MDKSPCKCFYKYIVGCWDGLGYISGIDTFILRVIKCCTKRIIRNNKGPLLSVWHLNHMMGVEDHTELD